MLVVAVTIFIYSGYRPADLPAGAEHSYPAERVTQSGDRTIEPSPTATRGPTLDPVALEKLEAAAAQALIAGRLDQAAVLYRELSDASPARSELAVAAAVLSKRAQVAEQSKANP